MYFDVPKVVRSPELDRGHDEESQNGRDVKIDILDDYIRTSERFRVIRVFFGVPKSYGNSPGNIWALLGHTGIEERGQKEGGARHPSSPNWKRGAAHCSLFLSPSFLLSYSNKGRRSPTRGGSRTPPLARPPPRPAASLPCSFIYGAGGHPIDTTIDH